MDSPSVVARGIASSEAWVEVGVGRLAPSSRALALVRAYPVATAAVVAGLAARVVFWVMTDRRIDDALITVKHARNAADGMGLTHHPGEALTHGFTSAISVLVPLVGEVAHAGSGLFALRAVSLVAFVLAIVCAAGIGRQLGISQWLMIFPLGYLAFDQNQIFYGMAGMETQIATAVLLAGVYALISERLVVTGALLGLALLARPDFILWVIPALIFLVLRYRRKGVVAASVTAAVVLPWIAFTSAYYGSPVPHTIRAKSLRFPTEFPPLSNPLEWFAYSSEKVSTNLNSLGRAWAPFRENGLLDEPPVDVLLLAYVALAFIALAVVGALRGRGPAAWLVAMTYLGLFVLYRVYFLPPSYYEWYYGPFMALAAVAAAGGLAAVHRLLPRTAIAAACALAVAFSMHVPVSFVIEQRQQHIEDRVRMPMARYLDDVVEPGQRVVSESAGYVGYYSHVTLYDYPGLTSPGALRALETLGPGRNSLTELTNAVRPEWLIMRPEEWKLLELAFPKTAVLYTLDRKFMIPETEVSLRFLGATHASLDREFLVLRRIGSD